ncbi:hypothetical protein GIB67_029699 [Kingdonia uniflora]|uniref:Large ribosomal subunit protein bL25 L25 domain-containing protein n=1 Tax=Kingdonia uniflora TaxID=39325 RepID=A0A7J7LLV9_9MAGN|nr:hypothetical protein GIB67_029699 [Kingdonia uniflora]
MGRLWQSVGNGLKRTLMVANQSQRSYHTIEAIPREYTGSKLAAKDRAQGRIPTVVSSQSIDNQYHPVARKLLLTTDTNQINSLLESLQPSFCSTMFKLDVRAGSGSLKVLESANVIPRQVHRDPETGKVLNLSLVWADEGSEQRVSVPVVFEGEGDCLGVKKDNLDEYVSEEGREGEAIFLLFFW